MQNTRRQRPTSRFDERDTMFARAARRLGTSEYDDYYRRRPKLREIDDRLRSMTPLLAPGAAFYDETLSGDAERFFREIEAIEPDRETVEAWAGQLRGAADPMPILEELARSVGAVAVGATRVDSTLVYTHRGRHDHHYGVRLENDLSWALVFLVEMDHEAMGKAPRAETILESARQYYRAAIASKTIEATLKRSGARARSQHDAHYDVILPALAVDAGLGELGRNNILVARRYGSRVRIGAVTCDLELEQAVPVDLGVAYFCEICRKCAENCPSNALALGDRTTVRGVEKWPTDVERCYGYWRRVGTDCGICMACCPFSHKGNALHGLVRAAVRRSRLAARVALWCDDLIYGRMWSKRRLRWL